MRAILNREIYHFRSNHPDRIMNDGRCTVCEFASEFVAQAQAAFFVIQEGGERTRATFSPAPPGKATDWLEFQGINEKEVLRIPAGCIRWESDNYNIEVEFTEE